MLGSNPSGGTMSKRRWTDSELELAVANSLSLAQVLRKLNLAIAGGSYTFIRGHILRLGLDTSHFAGQQGKNRFGKSKGLTLEQILVAGSPYQSSEIRRYILAAGIKENRCEVCSISAWNGKPITIELHHRNSVRNDHRIENLQMLCPNCHSQAERLPKW